MKKFSCCDLYFSIKQIIIKNNLDISVERIYVEDIIISYKDTSVHLKTNTFDLLKDFDIFIFRSDVRKNLNKTFFIAKALKKANKSFINDTFSNYTTFSDKLSVLNTLQELNINHPKTFYADSKELLMSAGKELDFPFILKDPYGWQGESVYLIKTQQAFEKKILQLPKQGFILQEYLPIDHDIRIIVIGYEAIGAMKRLNPKNDFRSNLSIGGTAKQISLTKDLKCISEQIANHINSAMLGIDFFIHNDKIYVIEIETSPGFAGFSQCTKTKPVSLLLNYLQKQYLDQKVN
jgi:RimK family alpha-L-glutamate ligase